MVYIVDACCWLQGLVAARQIMQNAYSLHVHSFRALHTERLHCFTQPTSLITPEII